MAKTRTLIEHKGTFYEVELKEGKYRFRIRGRVPSQDDVYDFATRFNLPVDVSTMAILRAILPANTIEEIIALVESFFRSNFEKTVSVKYVEENRDLRMSNEELVLPVISKNTGNLGTFVLTGNFELQRALGFLMLYDSFVSVIEGIVLTHRLGELLRSGLDAMYRALNKRARLSDVELECMESIAFKIAELEEIGHDKCEEALKTANIGLIGVKDETFQRIKAGDTSKEVFEDYLNHIDAGFDILQKFDIDKDILDVCLYHHEFIDGSGPKGLSGAESPKLALIVGLAEHIVILNWAPERLEGKYPDNWLEVIRESEK